MNFWMIGTINGIITLTWKKVTKVSKFTLYNDDVVVAKFVFSHSGVRNFTPLRPELSDYDRTHKEYYLNATFTSGQYAIQG